ncbi:MAG TPA: hypothetical protein VJ254_15290, partial [Streptosporangiaceae bacterium]|nr:hypothetical protein [Streptosporangiaceae bacterium]
KGQMDREFLAVIDGTLGGPDAIFKLMEFYLRELKMAHPAFRGVGVTSSSISAPSNALPRFQTL